MLQTRYFHDILVQNQYIVDIIDFSLKRLSIVDIVSNITDIRYIDYIYVDIYIYDIFSIETPLKERGNEPQLI